jgi:hypothetical protein
MLDTQIVLNECDDCGRETPDSELVCERGRFETHYYCRDCAGPTVIYDDDLGD